MLVDETRTTEEIEAAAEATRVAVAADLAGMDTDDDNGAAAAIEEGAATVEFKPEEKFPILNTLGTLDVALPEDFEITEETTEEDIKEKINEQLQNKYKPEGEEDSFTSEYNEAKAAGLTPEQFIAQKKEANEFFNLNADSGLKRYYQSQAKEVDGKQVRKYDDDAVNAHLDKMSPIDKDQMWDQIKNSIAGQQQQERKPEVNQYQTKVNEMNTSNEESYNAIFAEKGKQQNFHGLEFGESERSEFNKEFVELMKINSEREPMQVYPRKAVEIFNDPERLYDVLLIDKMIQSGKFNGKMKGVKDIAAAELLKRGGVAPKGKAGQSGQQFRDPPTSADMV
jgi:hypothetical protein